MTPMDMFARVFLTYASVAVLVICTYIGSMIVNSERPVTRRPPRRSWWTGRYYGGHRSPW